MNAYYFPGLPQYGKEEFQTKAGQKSKSYRIIDVVCEYYDIKYDKLLIKKNGSRKIQTPLGMCIYIIKKQSPSLTLNDIAMFFNRSREHIFKINNDFEAQISNSLEFKYDYEEIKDRI